MSADFMARLKDLERRMIQAEQKLAQMTWPAQSSGVVIDPGMQDFAAKLEEMKSALIRQGLDNLALASHPPKRGPGRPRKHGTVNG